MRDDKACTSPRAGVHWPSEGVARAQRGGTHDHRKAVRRSAGAGGPGRRHDRDRARPPCRGLPGVPHRRAVVLALAREPGRGPQRHRRRAPPRRVGAGPDQRPAPAGLDRAGPAGTDARAGRQAALAGAVRVDGGEGVGAAASESNTLPRRRDPLTLPPLTRRAPPSPAQETFA